MNRIERNSRTVRAARRWHIWRTRLPMDVLFYGALRAATARRLAWMNGKDGRLGAYDLRDVLLHTVEL
jgi:hypothetical protein